MSDIEAEARDAFLKSAINIDGICLPPFRTRDPFEEHAGKLKQLEMRTEDLFVLGYSKCGTHWIWEIVNMLVNGNTEYNKNTKGAVMLEIASREEIDALESPRILNSHHWFRFLPGQILTKKPKIIFLLRNPKDVCVSYFNHLHDLKGEAAFTGNFTTFLDMFLKGEVFFGSYTEYVADCERVMASHPDLPVHTVAYEDMKQKPVENVKRLADYIGVEADADMCSAIADACSFKNLKKADTDFKVHRVGSMFKEGAPGIYRKGIVGDWKNWFTVAQNEMFDRIIGEKLQASKFLSRYLK